MELKRARIVVVVGIVVGLLTAVAGTMTPAKAAEEQRPRVSVDPAPPRPAPGTVNAQVVTVAPFPLEQTFSLHSTKGADRVIYLDFNGETYTDTWWNDEANTPIVGPAYDTDGNPSAFSDTERANIQEIWMRVSEDYAPFAIDVTTEDPGYAAINRSGSGDTKFGTRALISDPAGWREGCGCAGVAYIGTYDMTSSHDKAQPAFVLYKAVYNVRSIAEVISHEVGHNLNLDHDGTGSTGYYSGASGSPWAPIMGTGYSRPVTQFSKGEYSGANNTEDDLALMAAAGAPPVVDDVGNTTAGAEALGVDNAAAGLIGTAADVDVFSFSTAGGEVTVNAAPAPVGPNLDVKLELLNAGGDLLASADPPVAVVNSALASGLDASFTQTLAPGNYFLRVQGVGWGNPATTGYSDYGSLGRYTLAATGALGVPPTLSVNDVIVGEGNSGTTNAAFTVSLSHTSPNPVTVQASTLALTATAGSDFTATNQLVTIPAGATSATVNVPVLGDTTPEGHETFSLKLTSPSGASALKAIGQGAIINDDGLGVSIGDVDQAEGSGVFTAATFTVSLSSKAPGPVSVLVSTGNGSATPAVDYSPVLQRVTFAKGEQTKTVTVVVRGDRTVEPDEKYTVWLSAPIGLVVTDPVAVGTIRNDD